LGELRAAVGAQRHELGAQEAREPARDGEDAEGEQCGECDVDHGVDER
jgi:hypothetical protein